MLVRVNVKIGDIGRSNRTNVCVENGEFAFDPSCGGFEDVRDRGEERVAASLCNYETKAIRPDSSIYLKPSVNAAQKDFIRLSASNFQSAIAIAQANFSKRTKVSGPFIAELFMFAARENAVQ